jgi:ribosomal protein S18 acetylase RimI-like enzyme
MRAPMPVIRPLTETEFCAWFSRIIPDYAAEKVESGEWSEDEALELSRVETATLLPEGMDTPGNYFYAITKGDGTQVGELWFATKERGTGRVAYIYDVSVWPEHQRQGHAFRAFQALEGEAVRLGLTGIALHVFGHNVAARALYRKLGYQPTNINMFKPLGTGG